jgi:DNA-binding beta-propeller fold protein YncE
MKRNLPVLHFLFLVLAFCLLTGCDMTTGMATQDSGERPKAVMVSTIAGGEGDFADYFGASGGIAIDATGNLYVADVLCIRKVTPAGEVSIFASAINTPGFHAHYGIAVDAAGNLYVADKWNHRIRKITPAGEVSTLAGGEEGFADGVGSDSRFNKPRGIAIDAAGNLYVADSSNDRIRKITPAGEVSTIAGTRFTRPSSIAIDAAGKLYVAELGDDRIHKITPEGKVSTLAFFANLLNSKNSDSNYGGGDTGFEFDTPGGIAIDRAGNLYVADTGNHRIRKITPAEEVSTLAGGEEGFADGSGNDARFSHPSGIAIDAAGNLYVADRGNHRIRKIEIR